MLKILIKSIKEPVNIRFDGICKGLSPLPSEYQKRIEKSESVKNEDEKVNILLKG